MHFPLPPLRILAAVVARALAVRRRMLKHKCMAVRTYMHVGLTDHLWMTIDTSINALMRLTDAPVLHAHISYNPRASVTHADE